MNCPDIGNSLMFSIIALSFDNFKAWGTRCKVNKHLGHLQIIRNKKK